MYQGEKENVRQRKFDDVKSRESFKEEKENKSDDSEKSKGWCEFVVSVILAVVLLFVIVLIILPCPIEPKTFRIQKAPTLTGVLTPNNLLLQAQRLHIGEVNGPESMVVDGDHLYTGTMDGKVLDIHHGHVKVLALLGKPPCGKFEDEPTCGRPLGLKLDKDGYLIVIDAYLGLFKINVATGDVHTLFLSSQKINGLEPKLLNDLVIMKDGTMYITDSSTKWDRRHHPYCIFEADDSGRLLKFDPKDNSMIEVLSGIMFANGLQLSPTEDYLLICESTRYRILKYYLDGSKKGELEIWADNLPGVTDNIRISPRGTYWVGLTGVRRAEKFYTLDFLLDKPWAKTLITKIVPLSMLANILEKYGLLIELNNKGEIIRSLHDPTGEKIPAVSEAAERDGVIYLGSYNLPYISKIYVRDLK